jgi:hypothetical protein
MATSAIGTFDFEGQALCLLNADESQISPVTLLTRKAFERWTEQSLHLNPARQTEETTKNYLLNRSYVLQNSKDETVGTFSVTDGTLENRPSQGFLLKRDSSQTFSTPPWDESHGLQGGVDWKSRSLA